MRTYHGLILTVISCVILAVVVGKVIHRSKRWEEFDSIEFNFDCNDRSIGFYADMEHDCKFFHMCDAYGRRVPHVCPNKTMFNQRFRICDWSYKVKCDDSPKYFGLNDLTYETDAPPADKP